MSRVAVFGASGRTGRAIVAAALGQGHDVTAVVRGPASFSPIKPASHPGGTLRVCYGDIRDVETIGSVIRGHSTVVSAVGPPGRRSLRLYSDAARALIPAMGEEEVRRLIVLSSAGVRHNDPNFTLGYRGLARTLLPELYADMAVMESMVMASDLDWTIVRPSRITDDPATGNVRAEDAVTPVDGSMIPRGDLAAFVAAERVTLTWVRTTPTLAT